MAMASVIRIPVAGSGITFPTLKQLNIHTLSASNSSSTTLFGRCARLTMWERSGYSYTRCRGGAFSTQCSGETLRWVSTVSAVALLMVKNTGVRKSLLVPLMALQMPQDVLAWMKGEYGLWSAFLALVVRLFYNIPGELELPLTLLLLVITAPYQIMQQRGTQAGLIIWATLSSYLGFQHITRAGGIGRAFQQNVIVPTLASICLVTVPVVLLYQGL